MPKPGEPRDEPIPEGLVRLRDPLRRPYPRSVRPRNGHLLPQIPRVAVFPLFVGLVLLRSAFFHRQHLVERAEFLLARLVRQLPNQTQGVLGDEPPVEGRDEVEDVGLLLERAEEGSRAVAPVDVEGRVEDGDRDAVRILRDEGVREEGRVAPVQSFDVGELPTRSSLSWPRMCAMTSGGRRTGEGEGVGSRWDGGADAAWGPGAGGARSISILQRAARQYRVKSPSNEAKSQGRTHQTG